MTDEQLHKDIETYIVANMPAGEKYSLNWHNPRDFSIANAPLFFEGVDEFVIFNVEIERGQAASIGNTAKRRVGIIVAEIHVDINASDRHTYKKSDILTAFLERKAFNGIILRDATKSKGYDRGKWRVVPWTFSFTTTQMIA